MTDPASSEDEKTLHVSAVRSLALSGAVTLVFREGIIRFLGLLANLVLARLLSPSAFGAIAFGYTLISFGTLLSDGGTAGALIRRETPPTQAELRAMLGFNLVATGAGAAVVAAVGLQLGQAGALAATMAVALPFDVLRVPSAVVLERTMSYRAFLWSDTSEILVYSAVSVALVVAGFGVWSIAIASLARALCGSIVLTTLGPVGWISPTLSMKTVRPFLAFGFKVQGANVINTLRDQSLNILTSALAGLDALGIWSFALRILQGIFLLLNSLNRVAFPAVSRLREAGESIVPMIERALTLCSAMIGFVVVAIAGTASALVPALFGARWDPSIAVLTWATGALLLNAAVSTAGAGYFYATDRAGVPLRATVAHTLVWLAVTAPLLVRFRATALGIGAFAASATDLLFLGTALSRDGIAVVRRCIGPAALVVFSGAAASFVARAAGPNLWSLALSLLVAEGLYLAGLWIFLRSTLKDVVRLSIRAVRH